MGVCYDGPRAWNEGLGCRVAQQEEDVQVEGPGHGESLKVPSQLGSEGRGQRGSRGGSGGSFLLGLSGAAQTPGPRVGAEEEEGRAGRAQSLPRGLWKDGQER